MIDYLIGATLWEGVILPSMRYSKQYFHLDDNENDGITDTIRYLSGNLDYNSRVMINAILSPFEEYSSQ